MLAPTRISWPSISNGSATSSRIFPATTAASSVPERFSRTIANSSPPRRETVSPARTQAVMRLGDLPEQIVAHLMPQAVVDVLEPIEVHIHDRHQPLGAIGVAQRLGGAVPKECPAEQPRQWVVVGQIGQAGLGLFTPRDVAHHPREQPPPPETDFADRHLQRKHRSILAQALDFAGTGTDYLARSGFEVMADIAVVPAVRLGYQHGDILSGDFRGGITEGARRGRIQGLNQALFVDDNDSLHNVPQDDIRVFLGH